MAFDTSKKQITRRHLAMATFFDLWLVGVDSQYLQQVAELCCNEISRIEQLLSFYDPGSELSRINREAHLRPIKVERELFSILTHAQECYTNTKGYFDISHASSPDNQAIPLSRKLTLHPDRQCVSMVPGVKLDLGGYGKGYALDKCSQLLKQYGVESAMLHGGTSSVWAKGHQATGSPWQIQIPDEGNKHSWRSYTLEGGFSFSESTHANRVACAVWTPTALEAEVYSTALVAMPTVQAQSFIQQHSSFIRARYLMLQFS